MRSNKDSYYCPPSISILRISRICYEAERGISYACDEPFQPKWEDAPALVRKRVIKRVLRAIIEPHLSCRAMHDRWLNRKLREGWSYNSHNIIDDTNKKHPHILPFESLPAEVQVKYHVFYTVVHGLVSVMEKQKKR